jgi:hypothetical protein
MSPKKLENEFPSHGVEDFADVELEEERRDFASM